jgi:hypothetical protein
MNRMDLDHSSQFSQRNLLAESISKDSVHLAQPIRSAVRIPRAPSEDLSTEFHGEPLNGKPGYRVVHEEGFAAKLHSKRHAVWARTDVSAVWIDAQVSQFT